ncbi:MAG: hypothetical protein C0467_05985 [Planctomycetaceae bacterium]|nr:hypothetical protein [Planctomycetaceae bacterium]
MAVNDIDMTPRDRFASFALMGLLASDDAADFPTQDLDLPNVKFDRRKTAARYAETAYILADAMLEARK